ncbi:MAG: nucleotidyltransferase domain-containing protein [Armatimonadetes bacterium]|nr:nucleotidyltransferase domain-containing protein [Armatimonadota bacterium]
MPAREERAQELQAELERIVEELKKLGALKIIVFGSMATGKVRAGSDLDLIVVMETDERFPDRMARLYRTLQPRVACDILAYTPEEFEQMPASSFLIRRALQEGVVLHEAG